VLIKFQQNSLKYEVGYEIHEIINYVWKKEKLPEQWKESTIEPICKKGDKTDCNNHRAISLLSPTYKIVSNIVLLKANSICRRNYWESSVWVST
jgi:hypothetical protein